jgi:hypothetical protein
LIGDLEKFIPPFKIENGWTTERPFGVSSFYRLAILPDDLSCINHPETHPLDWENVFLL